MAPIPDVDRGPAWNTVPLLKPKGGLAKHQAVIRVAREEGEPETATHHHTGSYRGVEAKAWAEIVVGVLQASVCDCRQ